MSPAEQGSPQPPPPAEVWGLSGSDHVVVTPGEVTTAQVVVTPGEVTTAQVLSDSW